MSGMRKRHFRMTPIIMIKKISLVLIILIVLVFNLLRFWKLDTIPEGFHALMKWVQP